MYTNTFSFHCTHVYTLYTYKISAFAPIYPFSIFFHPALFLRLKCMDYITLGLLPSGFQLGSANGRLWQKVRKEEGKLHKNSYLCSHLTSVLYTCCAPPLKKFLLSIQPASHDSPSFPILLNFSVSHHCGPRSRISSTAARCRFPTLFLMATP